MYDSEESQRVKRAGCIAFSPCTAVVQEEKEEEREREKKTKRKEEKKGIKNAEENAGSAQSEISLGRRDLIPWHGRKLRVKKTGRLPDRVSEANPDN